MDVDTLVREMTGRTPDRDQDWTVSAVEADRVFDRLADPDGLTERASTFTRPDVLVALVASLTGVGRIELEALADRLLAAGGQRGRRPALEERRWSTPELLAVEQRLVTTATGRTEEETAKVSHQAVREALAAHPTAGSDQQAMVRDLCQGGRGSPWWWGGPEWARPSPWASPAMPGSWTATDPGRGSDRDRHPEPAPGLVGRLSGG
jgi:hypothetical protein